MVFLTFDQNFEGLTFYSFIVATLMFPFMKFISPIWFLI